MVQHDEPEQARYVVTAIRRGLAILSLFRRERRVITVPEIASTLKLSRATAFRMAYTLERDGYLQRLPNSHCTPPLPRPNRVMLVSVEASQVHCASGVAKPWTMVSITRPSVNTTLMARATPTNSAAASIPSFP